MQQLEQALGYSPRLEAFSISMNGLERGVSALYTGEMIRASGHGFVVPYGNLGIAGLKDLHDTFKVDRFGNVYDGHTTVDHKIRINTDPLKSRKDILIPKLPY